MKKIVFCFLFVAIVFNVFPQLGPGYLGRRFQVGYGFHFSPALLGPNGSGESMLGRGNVIGGDMAFNSIHEGFLEFAFKNRTSVGFSAKYYKTTYHNGTVASAQYFDPNGYSSSTYGRPTGIYTINGLNYTLYFKFFNKRYVAPWGRYFILGPSLNTYKCFYDPSIMYMQYDYYDGYSNKVVKVSDFGPQGDNFFRVDLLFGWGRTRIVGERFTIDYGINFQAIALGFTLWDAIGENPLELFSEEETTNLNYFERTSKSRVREVNRLNIFLKVGVLLF